MELIRCDQCKAEISRQSRHYTIELAGLVRLVFDSERTVHLCSESCGAAWFAERAPTLAPEEQADLVRQFKEQQKE